MNPTRRHLLGAVASLALSPARGASAPAPAPATPKSAAQVAFLSLEEGAAALARPDDTYYARMSLLEIRARMRSPLPGMSLAEARVAIRDYNAAAVLAFTSEEAIAIRGVIDRMQSMLETRAPLYGRTPWSFIKLDDRAEGGLMHTRGPHIVMPRSVVEQYTTMHREMAEAGRLAVTSRGRHRLLHEQTHVLERADPARFDTLFTEVFGFVRMPRAPTSPWLDTHAGINPDGPDMVWAFPLDRIGGGGWVMPVVTFPDLPVPRMPQDFAEVGIEVAPGGDGWHIVEDAGVPRMRALGTIPGYHVHFPFPDEDFHPNEIAAVALAHWILRDVPDLDQRPLMAAIAGWAKTALA